LLGHDAAHKVGSRIRPLNEWGTEIAIAYPILIVMREGYRPWHFEHHRHLGSEVDPELFYTAGDPYRPRVTWRRIATWFVLDMLGFGIPAAMKFLYAVFPWEKPSRFLGLIAFWAIAFAAAYYFDALWIPLLWTWSLLTGFWAVFRVRTFTEHISVPWRGKETSHRFTAGPLARFLFVPHNTYCHYEHHKWPQVPYYYLPRLRELDTAHPVVPLANIFPWS